MRVRRAASEKAGTKSPKFAREALIAELRTPGMTKLLAAAGFDSLENNARDTEMVDSIRDAAVNLKGNRTDDAQRALETIFTFVQSVDTPVKKGATARSALSSSAPPSVTPSGHRLRTRTARPFGVRGKAVAAVRDGAVVLAEVDHEIVLDECAERDDALPMSRALLNPFFYAAQFCRFWSHYKRVSP